MRGAAAALAFVVLAGCTPAPDRTTAASETPHAVDGSDAPATQRATPRPTASASEAPRKQPPLGRRRPAWLGTRVLPRTAQGYGEVRPTPPVLRRRRFPTIDLLPPPESNRFEATVRRVRTEVVKRSTWSPACPVTRNELRYVTVTFYGFDGRPHTGELLVSAGAARDLVAVFRSLYRARYPIEEMRVVDRPELDLPPTGDGNNTTAFVCRPSRGSTSWSQHAYGLAVDVNPFFNPYVDDDVVLPELASYFTARDRRHPGMHQPDGPAVRAFDAIGWEWGGSWQSLKDYMHFSATGR